LNGKQMREVRFAMDAARYKMQDERTALNAIPTRPHSIFDTVHIKELEYD
jgi:hypothetical protein